MNELLLILAIIVGLILGLFFFGTLWMTVHYATLNRRLWILPFSALLRFSIVIFGFWAIGILASTAGQWQRLLACLAGFLLGRYLISKFIGGSPATAKGSQAK